MRSRLTVLRAVLAAAAALLTVPAGAGVLAVPAAASPTVACGDTIDGPVLLTSDLVCRGSAVGLTLLAGAELDLGGHRVVGGPTGTGLRIPSRGAVSVRNGTVARWGVGMSTDGAAGAQDSATVEGVTFRGNATGISTAGRAPFAPGLWIVSSRFVDNAVALHGVDGGFQVRSSTFVDNGTALSSHGNGGFNLVDSVVAHSDTGILCDDASCSIERTTLRDNGVGAYVSSFIAFEVRDGTIARNDVGVQGEDSLRVIVAGNVLRDNGTAVLVSQTSADVVDNLVVRNDVGFLSLTDAPAQLITGNVFRRNGDGILAVAAGAVVAGNHALHNERWGIHAPGAVDRGGNQARGNGNEPQCVGVVCGLPGVS